MFFQISMSRKPINVLLAFNEEFSQKYGFFLLSFRWEQTIHEEISGMQYNYEEGSWSIGSLERYSWLAAGVLDRPLGSWRV